MKKLVLFYFFLIPVLTFGQALSGNYVIGNANSDVNFKTLTAAVAKINAVGVSGPVTFLLDNTTYNTSTNENFPIKINQFSGSATYTLTIKPNADKDVTITSSDTFANNNTVISYAVFQLDGADNIIIDGSNAQNGSTRNLTIQNNGVTDYAARTAIWISSNLDNGANNITIKNIKLKAGTPNEASKLLSGIFVGSNNYNGNLLNGAANALNSNLSFTNNQFINVRQGVLVKGGASDVMKSQNILIASNIFGSTTDSQRSSSPVIISNSNNVNILDNLMDGLKKSDDAWTNILSGIQIENGSNYNIKRNIINNVELPNDSGTATGILVKGVDVNGTISENKISNVKRSVNGANLISGILVQSTNTVSNLIISNNFISNISNQGFNEYSSGAYGMYISGNGIKMYHNTVLINGAFVGISAALFLNSGNTFDIRNNILINTNSTQGVKRFAIYSNVEASAFTNINYNAYFAPKIGYLGGERATLTNWKNATGQDQNSKDVNPIFVSATDLHLQSVPGNAALDNAGANILNVVPKDIDAQDRSTTPDIGAHEFFAVVIPAITVSSTTLPAFSTCAQTASASQSFTLSGTNLTANIVATAPAGFELSKNDMNFSTAVSYVPTSGTVSASTIYARMTGTSTATISGTIAITSTNAITKNITISGEMGLSTTWNGSAWSNNAPTSTMTAIIAGNYNVGANINACSLIVNTNATVVIPTGYSVSLNGAITVESGSSFTLENNASLIQNGTTNSNSGSITVKRYSSPLKRLDYTLWSSPTTSGTNSQTLLNFSPLTTSSRFYNYKTETNLYSAVVSPETTSFSTGKGFLIRMPNTHPTTPTVWQAGSFKGTPNNGDYNVVMQNIESGKGFNLVGNPYPSPISAVQFTTANINNITGALYFWRKTNDSTQPSYYTWTTAGTTAPLTSDQTEVAIFQGVIQTGQGFFVEAKNDATNLIFNNTMRSDDHTNQFFKSASESTIEYNRIWLNASNAEGWSSQTLIAYFTNASNELDPSDGKYINDGDIAFTSLIENVAYTIQGKGLPFSSSDVVPMQLTVKNAGAYTIAIDHVDGLFEGLQNIYLRDNQTGLDHNLKAGSYTFNSEAGSFNNRFSIVYESLLSTDTPIFDSNSIYVSKKDNVININAGAVNISSVDVFDLLGRQIYSNTKVNSSVTSINDLSVADQVVLVKITTDKGIVTKKVKL